LIWFFFISWFWFQVPWWWDYEMVGILIFLINFKCSNNSMNFNWIKSCASYRLNPCFWCLIDSVRHQYFPFVNVWCVSVTCQCTQRLSAQAVSIYSRARHLHCQLCKFFVWIYFDRIENWLVNILDSNLNNQNYISAQAVTIKMNQ